MSREPARVWLQGRVRPLLLGVPCVVAGAVFLNFTKKWFAPRLRAVTVPGPISQLGDTRGLLEELEAGHVDVLDDLLRKGFALNGVIRGSDRGFCWTGLPPEQGTLLHWASYYSNVRAMELLMNAGMDVETADPTGCKPLHWASVAANTDGARRLLEAGANVEATAYSFTTPLHWASVNGDGNMVRCLVEAGANIGAIDEGSKTALHHAALRCNTGALQALLESNASLEATDARGRTPLHCAAERIGTAALKILVDAGANLEARDCQGKTPLHYAIAKGCSVEGVGILLAAGAKIDAVDDDGKTPLHYVGDWVSPSNIEAVRMLVEAGSNVGATDAERKTPLHYAVRGNPDSVKLLFATGASLEAADADGKTALHCAAESAKTEALRILVDAGANLEALDGHGKTPLHYAAASDWIAEGARILVEAGANVDAVDDQGKTPLHYGAESKLHSGDNTVKALVEAGASLEIADKDGRTPLHSAILNRALSVARYLTDVGASPRTRDASGETPLHRVALCAVRVLAEAFVQAGANVRAVNSDGQTPLHYAAESGEEGIAQLLVDAGATVDAQDGDGRTPLHWAAECDKTQVAAVLVKAGADVLARDNEGRTAAQISTEGENSAVVELLAGDTSEGHVAAEGGTSASPSATAMQRTHSLTDSRTGDASDELLRKLLGDSQDDSSQFNTDHFEVQSGLRLQSQTTCILSARRMRLASPMCNFLQEKDDRTVVPIDHDPPPATEEPNNPRDAICRLSVGGLVAKKYRIASESITCEGYMRTALEMGSQMPVSLKFYEDLVLMKKHASILKRYKKFSWVCRFVRTIDRHGMLPGCIVLRGTLQPLEDWLHTPDVSIDSKLKMLRSLAIALAGLHGQGYVHLDVSASSVAFCTDDRTCKFLSLDWMTLIENQAEIQSAGRFVAPELLSTRCKLSYQPYQSAADMWSYGVIAYETLTGDKLYDKEFNRGDDLIMTLQGDSLSRKLNSVIDKRHRHFIKKFLNLDPKKRHTALAALKSSLLRSTAGAGCGCRCAANI